MRRIRTVVITLAAVVLALAVGFGVSYFDVIGNKSPKVDSTMLEASFKDIAELATEEYNYRSVGKYSDEQGWFGFGNATFLVVYEGTVKAGISDFSKVDVTVDDTAVQITAPDVQVLSSTIDPTKIETYDQSFNPFNQITPDDVATFLSTQADVSAQQAVDGGLLDRARTHAEQILTAQVRSLMGAEAQVTFNWVAVS